MGGFALLLRPFDKLLAKLLDRGLEAGESYFSRETGEVSFAVSGGKKLTAPFEEFDAYVERVIEAGGIFYRLMFVHRYTGKQFSQTSLSRAEPAKEEVMALWDMLQRYMDISQPLPYVPRLEPFRHLDPLTVEHDQRIGRDPRFWRDLNLEAWKQGEGAEWLRRQMEYPWDKRTCRLTPKLGQISMAEYRKQRPASARTAARTLAAPCIRSPAARHCAKLGVKCTIKPVPKWFWMPVLKSPFPVAVALSSWIPVG